MKKLLLTLLGLGLMFSLSAQTAGFKIGGLISTASFNDDSKTALGDAKMKFGYHAGLVVDVELVRDAFSIQTGLNMAVKGFKTDFSTTALSIETRQDLYYVDVPLLLKPSYRTGDLRIFGLAGGYFGYGVLGKFKSTTTATLLGTTATTEDTRDIEWGTNETEDDNSPIDYGLRLGAGAEFNYSLYFALYYDIGLADITPNENLKVSNTVIGVSIGAMFGGNNY